MAATIPRTCPHCRKENVVFTVRAEIPWDKEKRFDPRAQPMFFQTLATCGNCGRAVVALFRRSSATTPTPLDFPGQYDTIAGNVSPLELVDIFPKPTPREPPRHLPENVERAMREAYRGLDGRAPTSAVIMARKAVELALDHLGVPAGRLAERIDRARGMGLIAPALADWAHEIRLMGNEAAHSDMLDPDEDRAEAEEAISFTEMFLQYTITLPEEIRRRREEARARR